MLHVPTQQIQLVNCLYSVYIFWVRRNMCVCAAYGGISYSRTHTIPPHRKNRWIVNICMYIFKMYSLWLFITILLHVVFWDFFLVKWHTCAHCTHSLYRDERVSCLVPFDMPTLSTSHIPSMSLYKKNLEGNLSFELKWMCWLYAHIRYPSIHNPPGNKIKIN